MWRRIGLVPTLQADLKRLPHCRPIFILITRCIVEPWRKPPTTPSTRPVYRSRRWPWTSSGVSGRHPAGWLVFLIKQHETTTVQWAVLLLSLSPSLQYSGILFLMGRCLKLQIPVTATVKHVFVTQTLSVSSCPSRDGCVQFQPVHHAQLHVLHFPAALPGAVRLHLHKKFLPQEDHHHLDKRRSTSKNSHLLIYMCVCVRFFFSLLV